MVETGFVGPYRLGRGGVAAAAALSVPAMSPTSLVLLASALLLLGVRLLRRRAIA